MRSIFAFDFFAPPHFFDAVIDVIVICILRFLLSEILILPSSRRFADVKGRRGSNVFSDSPSNIGRSDRPHYSSHD